MASNAPVLPGMDLRLFMLAQSAYQDLAANYPAATDAVTVLVDGGYASQPAQSVEMIADEANGNAFPLHVVEQAQGGTASLAILGALSGTPSTLPDWSPLLAAIATLVDSGGESTTTTGAGSGAGTAAQVIPVTSATGFEVGGAFGLVTGGRLYLRRITGVSGTDITFNPPLKDLAGNNVTPANGDTIRTLPIYSLRSDIDDDDALTIFAAWRDYQERLLGWFPQTVSLGLIANGKPTLTASGPFRRRDPIRRATLAGNINDAVTSLGTSVPVGPETLVSPYYILIGTEILQVTAQSADGTTTYTVARGALGSSAAAHTAGDIIYPYRPAATVANAIPTGMCGSPAMVGLYAGALQGLAVEITTGSEPNPQVLGDCQLVPGFTQTSKGSVRITGTMLFDSTTGQQVVTIGERRESTTLFGQQGNEPGAAIAVWAPTVRLDEPPVANADKVSIEVAGSCMSASASGSPLYIIIG